MLKEFFFENNVFQFDQLRLQTHDRNKRARVDIYLLRFKVKALSTSLGKAMQKNYNRSGICPSPSAQT